MDINCLVEKLCNDKNFLNKLINDLSEKPDLLDYSDIKEYRKYSGILKAEVLEKFLKRMNRRKRIILPQIINYSDSSTITYKNFKKIIKFNKKFRCNVLISLAHCDISIYQLLYINKLGICVESFCRLLSIYSHDNYFSSEDLKKLIIDSKNIKNKNLYLRPFLEKNEQVLTKSKIEVLNYFLQATQ